MKTQVLRNSGERLLVTLTLDGVATDPDTSAASVTITRDSDGTAVATNAAAVRVDTGVYAYTLPVQSDLDELTVVWSGQFSGLTQSVTTSVDIVGGYYVSLAELRAMKNLENTADFTTDKLIEARQWFETKFERHTGRAFVPRYKKLTVWGSGTDTLKMPDQFISTLRSIRYGTVDLGSEALANTVINADGTLQRYWPFQFQSTDEGFAVWGQMFPGNARVTVVYEYGMASCPDDVRDAAKTAIYDHLLNDQTGRREYAAVTDLGIIRYSKPGPGRPFGIESVDEVANDRRRPGWRADRLTAGSVPIG